MKPKKPPINSIVWGVVDGFLRTRPAHLLFFALLSSEIRRSARAIKFVSPSTQTKPRLVMGLSENKRRISLGEGRVPISLIKHNHTRRTRAADQLIVDAFLESRDALELFLHQQESNRSKPYWDVEYSQLRVGTVERLLQVNTQDFVIWVIPSENGYFEVIDGDHRLRIARIRGLEEIRVVFFLAVPSIDWGSPKSTFLTRLSVHRK